MKGIRITGWGIAVPDKVVTNDDMALRSTRATSGSSSAPASASATSAARRRAWPSRPPRLPWPRPVAPPSEIDHLVLATTTPDGIVPGTAPSVQHGIGIKGGAFDLNAACSGFVYGLSPWRA